MTRSPRRWCESRPEYTRSVRRSLRRRPRCGWLPSIRPRIRRLPRSASCCTTSKCSCWRLILTSKTSTTGCERAPRMRAVNSTLPGMEKPLIKVAVPNKGALSEPAAEMLREAGYAQRSSGGELALLEEVNGVEFFYLRPRDIAVYVGEGTLDVGITGRDMLLDSRA